MCLQAGVSSSAASVLPRMKGICDRLWKRDHLSRVSTMVPYPSSLPWKSDGAMCCRLTATHPRIHKGSSCSIMELSVYESINQTRYKLRRELRKGLAKILYIVGI